MVYEKVIGRIHPGFFTQSNLFADCKIKLRDKRAIMESPFFLLGYDHSTGTLGCDDEDVLYDFADLIADNYGPRISREEMKGRINWDTVRSDWNVLNVGVCNLDDVSGWDGSVNAVWYDSEEPSEVIDLYFQYWNIQLLMDCPGMGVKDLREFGSMSVVLPNLVDALLHHEGGEREAVSNLIFNLRNECNQKETYS